MPCCGFSVSTGMYMYVHWCGGTASASVGTGLVGVFIFHDPA